MLSPTKLNPGRERMLSTLPMSRILLCSRMKSRRGPARHRFEFLAHRDIRPLQGYRRLRRRLHPDAQTDVEEVPIAGPAFPHPGPPMIVSKWWVAMDVQLAAALLLRGPLHLVTIIVELPPQVRAALLLPLPN